MGTPVKNIGIFCLSRITHHVSVHTCKRIEITASAAVITDRQCARIAEYEGAYNITVSEFCPFTTIERE
jgi:hypothetical protein